jgi:NAD(P)-dependent dehydrogenase (short-subunit alcohol dehydrogenase family)
VRRRLRNSVVVLTGATSGAGLEAAHAFARHGARLVLAGRDAVVLDRVAEECEALGATAVGVPTDLTDPQHVERLRDRAVERFGRIDTWVEVAATLLAGPLPGTPVADIEQTIRTNVLGTTLAARVALEQFERQREGVLINTSSVLAVVPNPMVPVYNMTKFAIRGLTLSLRNAYPRRGRIRVCEVMPGPIDTPMFERAANYTGHQLRAVPPASAPARVASAYVRCARRPRALMVVGNTSRLVLLGLRVVPGFTRWAVARYSGALLLRKEPAPATSGSAMRPQGDGASSGGWRLLAWRRRAGDALGRTLAR